MDKITKTLHDHYQSTFVSNGETAKGVDWRDKETMELRFQKMFEIKCDDKVSSWLDVGCGYGGFGLWLHEKARQDHYSGVEVVSELADSAIKKFDKSSILKGDFLELEIPKKFDYVICNGILTQKLSNSLLEMDQYSFKLIEKMFAIAEKGIAFNIMSSYVNFFAPNLYYKNPAEVFVNCASRFGSKIKIDQSYGLYEFTTYIYK